MAETPAVDETAHDNTPDVIAALLREKEGYVSQGNTDQAAQVDESLKALGYVAEKPAKA